MRVRGSVGLLLQPITVSLTAKFLLNVLQCLEVVLVYVELVLLVDQLFVEMEIMDSFLVALLMLVQYECVFNVVLLLPI